MKLTPQDRKRGFVSVKRRGVVYSVTTNLLEYGESLNQIIEGFRNRLKQQGKLPESWN